MDDPTPWTPPLPVWPVLHETRPFRPGWYVRRLVDAHGHHLRMVVATNVAAFTPETDLLRAAVDRLERSIPPGSRSDRASLDDRPPSGLS